MEWLFAIQVPPGQIHEKNTKSQRKYLLSHTKKNLVNEKIIQNQTETGRKLQKMNQEDCLAGNFFKQQNAVKIIFD